jgi:hypothetical protein
MESYSIPRIYRAHHQLFHEIPADVAQNWQAGDITLAHLLTASLSERSADSALLAFLINTNQHELSEAQQSIAALVSEFSLAELSLALDNETFEAQPFLLSLGSELSVS